jgi:hypothetical protein
MALVINDRVKETTTTTGTGALTLAGAVTGFETFGTGVGNSNTTYYAVTLPGSSEFEVGLGTLNGDSTTITRTTVISSSNSDSAVNFSAGTKTIFCTLPASKTVFLDASGNSTFGGDVTVTGDLTVTGDDITMNTNTSGHVLVADGTNYNPVAISGDVTIASNGAVTIAAGAVENSMLADDAVGADELAANAVVTASIVDANVTLAKIANQAANTVLVRDADSSGVVSAKAVTDTQILIGDGTGFTAASLSGDVTMTNAGAVTIANGAVENAMLADDAVGADELAANAVVNASVASGAAIAFSKMADLTASRALVSDGSGDVSVSAVTSTEIGYLDGVTSAIQTQIDTKASKGFAVAMAIAL